MARYTGTTGRGRAAAALAVSAACLGTGLARDARGQQAASSESPTVSPVERPPVEGPPVEGQAPGPAAAVDDPDTRDALLKRPEGKRWLLAAEAQYRSLLVTDEDPANNRYMLYRAQVAYYPLPWLGLYTRWGLYQRFVSVDAETGLRLEDGLLGATADQPVSLEPLGVQRTLNLLHYLRVYLPTSFASQQQDLAFAAEWSTRARLRLVDELFAGVRGTLHYRFNEFAEQAGPEGGTLPRFVAELQAFVEYSPLVSDRWGTLTAGATLIADETLDYPSRDPASLAASELPPGTLSASNGSIAGAGSSDSFMTPHYGYELYLAYVPPMPYLSFIVSLEQSGNVLRYGEPRLYFIHRDQTELALHLVATY